MQLNVSTHVQMIWMVPGIPYYADHYLRYTGIVGDMRFSFDMDLQPFYLMKYSGISSILLKNIGSR